jgi:hypothetical protein
MTEDRFSTMDLSKLHAELEALNKARDDVEFKLKVMGVTITSKPGPCYFLEKLPIEIRNDIYTMLLMDARLGEISLLDLPFSLGPNTQ